MSEKKPGRGAARQNLPPSDVVPDTMSKERAKVEFARRLNRLMILKGWNQSELARQAQAKAPEGVAMTRDKISKYISGQVLPNPSALDALCKALGVEPVELIPLHGVPEAGDGTTKDLGNGMVWLKLEQAMDWPTALKILQLAKGGAPK